MAAAFLAVAVYSALTQGPPPLTTKDVQANIDQALASMTPPPAFSQVVYDQVRPSIVLIQVTGGGTAPGASAGPSAKADPSAAPARRRVRPPTHRPVRAERPPADPSSRTRHVPGARERRRSRQRRRRHRRGDILTGLHVVAEAPSISVTFADGTKSTATIASQRPGQRHRRPARPTRRPRPSSPATLGNPDAMRIGSEAYVVGNPFGLYGSISAGVVSGLDRSFQIPRRRSRLHGLIQVDAAVNPGNSGGPLARPRRPGRRAS